LIALCGGRPRDAVEHFAAVGNALESAGIHHASVYRFRGDQIESLILAGQLVAAKDRLRSFETGVARVPTPWGVAIASRSWALVAAATGDLIHATRELEHALEHHEALPMPIELGRTLLLKGQLHRRQKAPASSRDLRAHWSRRMGDACATKNRRGSASDRSHPMHSHRPNKPSPEGLDPYTSYVQVQEAGPLPEVPLIVVTAGVSEGWPPGWDAELFDALRAEQQAELATLVTGGRQVFAETSGHHVPSTQPEVVIEAVESVLAEVDGSNGHRLPGLHGLPP
jgi:hypothetical protein